MIIISAFAFSTKSKEVMNVSTFEKLSEFENSDKDDKFIINAFISSRSVLESSSE
jgi:hypothetical protein